jgi:PIN domain nuclease of toxin-antitoxin system
MPISGAQALAYFRRAGYQLVDVTPEHAAAVEGLPAIHADPFDRLLVAQALHEPMRLVTHDQMVAAYSSSIIRI